MNKIVLENIPVILVAAGNKISLLGKIIFYLNKNGGFKKFYIISPEQDIKKIKLDQSLHNITINLVNEKEIIPNINLKIISEKIQIKIERKINNQLLGWYYQQFLKLGFAKYILNEKYYLIWDADTILTKKIDLIRDGKILLTQGKENKHNPYFLTIKKLFPYISLQENSHISQHMLIKVEHAIKMINEIDQIEQAWWINILRSLTDKSKFQFSEYETYSNYCLFNYPSEYITIKRNWFRYGRSYFGNFELKSIDIMNISKLYDFISFEEWDIGRIRYIRSVALVVRDRILKLIGYDL